MEGLLWYGRSGVDAGVLIDGVREGGIDEVVDLLLVVVFEGTAGVDFCLVEVMFGCYFSFDQIGPDSWHLILLYRY